MDMWCEDDVGRSWGEDHEHLIIIRKISKFKIEAYSG